MLLSRVSTSNEKDGVVLDRVPGIRIDSQLTSLQCIQIVLTQRIRRNLGLTVRIRYGQNTIRIVHTAVNYYVIYLNEKYNFTRRKPKLILWYRASFILYSDSTVKVK